MTEEVKKEEKETAEVKLETPNDEDEFNQAFDDAIANKPQETEEKKEESDSDETKETSEDGTPKDNPLSDDKTQHEQDTSTQKTQREIELEEKLAKAEHTMSTWEGRISAANKKAKEAEERAKSLEQAKESGGKEEPKDNLPDDDESKAIEEFTKEFPDLHKPIVAIVKRDLLPIIGQMIDDKIGKIEPQVASITEKIQTDSTEAHFAALTKAHSDWKSLVEDGSLDKWIETKPTYIQEALDKVKSTGSTQEVIDMFNQFKEETGKVSQNNSNDSSKNDKSNKAKDLLAVPASPTTPSTQQKKKDKDDFDAGWSDAMKSESK